jgi:hypothetical protein
MTGRRDPLTVDAQLSFDPPIAGPWHRVRVSDPRLRALRDRHYSTKYPGGRTVGPPARRLALVTEPGDAGWMTSWPELEYARHGLGDAWLCTLFRNESPARLSSGLILDAEQATLAAWGEPPDAGFVTFVDADRVRRKRDPGRCFRKAGWRPVGSTSDRGLLILHKPAQELRVTPPVTSCRVC